jgi:hypothetical protein
MIDYQKLAELAKAAIHSDIAYDSFLEEAGGPEVILALLQELEAAKQLTKATAMNYDAMLVHVQAERDAPQAKLKQIADKAFDTLDGPTQEYYRGLKLVMDMALAAMKENAAAGTAQKETKPKINWEPIQEFWRNNSHIDWDALEAAVKTSIS